MPSTVVSLRAKKYEKQYETFYSNYKNIQLTKHVWLTGDTTKQQTKSS